MNFVTGAIEAWNRSPSPTSRIPLARLKQRDERRNVLVKLLDGEFRQSKLVSGKPRQRSPRPSGAGARGRGLRASNQYECEQFFYTFGGVSISQFSRSVRTRERCARRVAVTVAARRPPAPPRPAHYPFSRILRSPRVPPAASAILANFLCSKENYLYGRRLNTSPCRDGQQIRLDGAVVSRKLFYRTCPPALRPDRYLTGLNLPRQREWPLRPLEGSEVAVVATELDHCTRAALRGRGSWV
ncbi:hypothetical protein EVAR_55391_1 [Eumeta japonica]|uniref:Uncharacterized protein n=1 Tax=Eumeta variegata TaxID=151549 RepID=A0A4C1YTK5_EUMVA|nr:hypothetical protein EVAR_55391_1 [Eumeta japonica]